MNIRRTKQGLWFLTVVLAGCGVTVLLVGLWLPYAQPEPYALSRPSEYRSKSTSQAAIPTLEEFKKIWNINLRPPLQDPAPQMAAPDVPIEPTVAKTPRPDLKLIGYAVESDYSLAILMASDGTIEFKAAGEELGDVTVRSITSDGVLLEHDGDEYTLKFDENQPQAPSAATPRNYQRVDRSRRNVRRYR